MQQINSTAAVPPGSGGVLRMSQGQPSMASFHSYEPRPSYHEPCNELCGAHAVTWACCEHSCWRKLRHRTKQNVKPLQRCRIRQNNGSHCTALNAPQASTMQQTEPLHVQHAPMAGCAGCCQQQISGCSSIQVLNLMPQSCICQCWHPCRRLSQLRGSMCSCGESMRRCKIESTAR